MPCCCNQVVMPAAPSSLVAVPIICAPAAPNAPAIAWPMPRDAPLTSATSLLSITASCGRAQRGANRFGVFQSRATDFAARRNTAIEASEHFARAAFEQLRGAATYYLEHCFGPAHRTGQLFAEQLADLVRITVLARIDCTYISVARRLKSHGRKVRLEPFRSRKHQARMRRHADWQQ